MARGQRRRSGRTKLPPCAFIAPDTIEAALVSADWAVSCQESSETDNGRAKGQRAIAGGDGSSVERTSSVAVEKSDSHLVFFAPDDFAETAHASVLRKQQEKPVRDVHRRVDPQPSSIRRKIAHCAVGKRLQLEYGYPSRLMDRLPGTASSFDRHVAPAPGTFLV